MIALGTEMDWMGNAGAWGQASNPAGRLVAKIAEARRRLERSERLRQSAENMLAEAAADCRAAQAEVGGAAAGCQSFLGVAQPWRRTARVAIYSDEPILAAGLKSLIAGDAKLKLAACCKTVSQLKEQLRAGRADVAVVDFTEEVTAATLVELGNVAPQCKLILWTNGVEGDMAWRAIRFGIRGVLRKTLPLEAHRQCLHRVNAGDLWYEKQAPESVN